MKFQSRVYNVFTKSKLVECFSEKRVDKDIMLEYYTLLEDQNIFSRYVFNILDIACCDMKNPLKDFNEVKSEYGDFFREVVTSVQELIQMDIDIETYVDLWLYLILCGLDNRVLTDSERSKILASLEIPKKSHKIELCFLILYLGEYIDTLLKEVPVNLELVKELTASLSTYTEHYNRTINLK